MKNIYVLFKNDWGMITKECFSVNKIEILKRLVEKRKISDALYCVIERPANYKEQKRLSKNQSIILYYENEEQFLGEKDKKLVDKNPNIWYN